MLSFFQTSGKKSSGVPNDKVLEIQKRAPDSWKDPGSLTSAGPGLASTPGILYGFHLYLGKEAEALGWKEFLNRLPCTKATQEVFLERGRILMERCTQQASLVLL